MVQSTDFILGGMKNPEGSPVRKEGMDFSSLGRLWEAKGDQEMRGWAGAAALDWKRHRQPGMQSGGWSPGTLYVPATLDTKVPSS